MAEPILVKHDSGTVAIMLNRPASRNALSHDLLCALADALAAPFKPGTTGVNITGAGLCFSAGADYRELTGTIKDLAIDEDIARVTSNIRTLAIPVTAVINGACLGGAVDLALACDQRVATHNAYFQVPATRLGILYNPASVQRMVLRYGKEIVTRLLVMGERFEAPAALAAGMVSSLTGSDSTVESGKVQPDNSQNALSPVATATKKMIDSIDRDDFDPEYWEQVRREILSSKQRFEAVAAFKSRMQSR